MEYFFLEIATLDTPPLTSTNYCAQNRKIRKSKSWKNVQLALPSDKIKSCFNQNSQNVKLLGLQNLGPEFK